MREDPYGQYNFLIEIDDLVVGGFSSVKGLDFSIEYEDIKDGRGVTHRLPKTVKYSNLVLERGLTDHDVLWGWCDDVVQALKALAGGKGLDENAKMKRNGSIYLLDAARRPAMWWNFKNAYPVKWTGPQLDAKTGNVAVESIELAHDGIERPAASRNLSKTRLAASMQEGM